MSEAKSIVWMISMNKYSIVCRKQKLRQIGDV